MPFLRFTRDKRGYETTSLVHASRRGGRARPRVLYWFRTPPGVRVGRPALDEEAIRWIEEHNPDIEFDWPKILDAQPPPATPAKGSARQSDEGRKGRGRRDRSRPADEVRPPPPPAPEPETALELEPRLEAELEPLAALAFEQLTHPEAEEKIDPPAMPIEQHVGHEQLTRLRARYAELLARIAERGGDPERVEALRTQAEALNPDAWVTDEEVKQGVESFEPKIRDLRAALGLRRRRRSRRGGRRRRGEGQGARGEGQEGSGEAQGARGEGESGNNEE